MAPPQEGDEQEAPQDGVFRASLDANDSPYGELPSLDAALGLGGDYYEEDEEYDEYAEWGEEWDEQAVQTWSEAGDSDVSEATLRVKLSQEYDPSIEEIGVFYNRVQHYSALVEAYQFTYDISHVMRLLFRAEFRSRVHGMNLKDQVHTLKSEAWDLMGNEPDPNSEEYEQFRARMESLMKVLSEFGVRPSGTHGKLFSNPNSPVRAPGPDDSTHVSAGSQEVTRGRGAGTLPPVGPLPGSTEAGAAAAHLKKALRDPSLKDF